MSIYTQFISDLVRIKSSAAMADAEDALYETRTRVR